MRRLWINSDNRLFRVEDAPVFMPLTGVRLILPEKGRAILYGALPDNKDLAQVIEGKTFEIVRKECGHPAEYSSDDVIILLHRCRVRTSWLVNPVPFHAGHELMFLYVSVDCEVEISP